MAGIVFYFEDNDLDVWSGRNIDLDAWNYAAKVGGGIDRMIVVNKTAQVIVSPNADLVSFDVVSDFPSGLLNAVYFVAPSQAAGAISLVDYDHSADWYCFGPALGWQEAHSPKVVLEGAEPIALHSVHVATAVMFHRNYVLNVAPFLP